MRLPQFNYLEPSSLEEALDLMAVYRDDAKILAGGTDLLVRMKKGLTRPGYLISLKSLDSLSFIKTDKDTVRIGPRTTLADVIGSDLVRQEAPALVQALETVGAVSIQHFCGTIGGNILQENRCMHYNQSSFHRSGRQPCHKDGGKICYSRENADRCYSTCQSDGATALMALNASITLVQKGGERTIDLAAFYTMDGIMPFAMESQELLAEIIVPLGGIRSAYKRLAYRSAIDFPIVSAGVLLKTSDTTADEIFDARIVVGAMGRSPLFLAQASASLKGKKLGDQKAFKKAAETAMDNSSAFAVHNVGSSLTYRCAMVSPMVFQALVQAARG